MRDICQNSFSYSGNKMFLLKIFLSTLYFIGPHYNLGITPGSVCRVTPSLLEKLYGVPGIKPEFGQMQVKCPTRNTIIPKPYQ